MRRIQLRLLMSFLVVGLNCTATRAESGFATIYSARKGANGELTAAHRTLPLGSRVRVMNRKNGRSVTVHINDRGPFVRGRVIDVSPTAARVLGFSGKALVDLIVVQHRHSD
jgi:rare lipoprotein A